MQEPLVQTQVIPYLRELVKGGHELTLLTFEPGAVDEAAVRESLKADGIEWHWLKYHKRPSVPATLFDIANGARFIRKLASRQKFDILHCRSHVPMIMAAVARKGMRDRPKLLFDIRGFLPEEYVDAGVWAMDGSIYRGFKRVESWLMKEADGFVVLTEAARQILFSESRKPGLDAEGRPVEVIPCCVDFDRRFSGNPLASRSMIRKKLNIEGRLVFTHIGALGGVYLSDKMAELLSAAKKKDRSTFALFLTQSNPIHIVPLLKEKGFGESDFYIEKVPASDVENYLYASDVGLSFVKSTYSTKSRSPTKIPEYLAGGLPVISNSGVGDVDEQLNDSGIGVIVQGWDTNDLNGAIDRVLSLLAEPATSSRCIKKARESFDLESVGGARYRNIYARMLGQLSSHLPLNPLWNISTDL